MRIPSYKRLRTEDFTEEERPLVDKLASPINDGFQTLYEAMQNNVTFNDNISSTIAEFQVSIEANGTPRNNIFIKLSNNLKVIGVISMQVTPLDDAFPLSALGLTWQQTTKNNLNGLVINNIQGLPPFKNFFVRVLIIN